LLALMLRMRDYLQSRPVKVANTSYPRVVLPQSFNSRHEAAWQKIVHFVQMHLHEQISITTIAQKVDISATRLNSLSHQFCGVSLMRYVRQQRIAAAKAMLRTQPESIKEIAMLLNFKSAAAFCSVFRKETGLTPKQFRRQAR
jgi:AraC-like DNA-binding protein